MNRDEVSLEGGPIRKRQQLDQDGFSEESDEEVLGLEELPSSDEEEDDDDNGEIYDANEADIDNDDDVYDDNKLLDEDPDASGWGRSKRDYYDADDIADEADAKEEEVEARRLQAKQLASLSAADFVFDEDDWKEKGDSDDDGDLKNRDEVVLTSVDVHASPEEQKKLLKIIHPEFQLLSDEFLDLEPELKELTKRVKSKSKPSASATLKMKFTVLSTYMGVLSMYFALLTVSRPEGELSNVKDHSIMDSLLKCRQAWLNVAEDEESEDEIEAPKELTNGATGAGPHITNGKVEKQKQSVEKSARVERKRKRESDTSALLAEKRRAQRNAKAEASLASLDDLLNTTPSTTASKKVTLSGKLSAPKSSDFGEEGHLDVDDAEAKAKRKKSLRFYTSQIVQKNDKRGRAGRDAGGDMDVPHKEREKERKERLTAEAIRRGQQSAGDDLDDNDFDEEDMATGRDVRDETALDTTASDLHLNTLTNEDEDYYNKIASLTSTSKTKKKLIHDAEKSGDRVIETEVIDPTTGKRGIGYTIEKNKGLTPHRKKDVRNPRVKKRKKYEAAKKKLGSTKAIFKQPTKAYAGETTGIKTRLVKSVKFK